MVRAVLERNTMVARDVLSGFYATTVNVLLTVVFLAHQTLLSLDAVVRTLIRRIVTHERLLEWETAEQSEMGAARRTPVDRYLDWMPAAALGIGLLLLFFQPKSLLTAMPFLIWWAFIPRFALPSAFRFAYLALLRRILHRGTQLANSG
jgi:hypothetical protein